MDYKAPKIKGEKLHRILNDTIYKQSAMCDFLEYYSYKITGVEPVDFYKMVIQSCESNLSNFCEDED